MVSDIAYTYTIIMLCLFITVYTAYRGKVIEVYKEVNTHTDMITI